MESTSSSSSSRSASNSNSLELKIMSCKDLRAFNFFQKLTVYAQVSIVDDTRRRKSSDNKTAVTSDHHQQQQRQKHRTPTDKEGNRNPEWNHSITLDLNPVIASFNGGGGSGGGGGGDDDDDRSFLHFVLRHEGAALFGDKTIGVVSVPLKRLIEESRGVVRCLSYQVRTTAASPHRGKPNGVLTFSCKFNHCNDDVDCTINNPTTTTNQNPNQNPKRPQHQLVLTQKQNQTTEAVLLQDSPPKQLHEFPSPDGNIRYPSIQVDEEEEEIMIGYPILELQNDILSKEVEVKDQEETTRMMSHDHQYRDHQDRPYGGGGYSYYYPPLPPPPPPPPPPVYYPHPAGVPQVTAGMAYSYGGCYCDCPNKHQHHEYCSGCRQGNGGWWRPTSLGRY